MRLIKIIPANPAYRFPYEHAVFFCPACLGHHCVPIERKKPTTPGVCTWFFNGNMEKPTLEPSLRIFKLDGKTTACHVVVTDGILNYCGDAGSGFAGKSIPMQGLPTDRGAGRLNL